MRSAPSRSCAASSAPSCSAAQQTAHHDPSRAPPPLSTPSPLEPAATLPLCPGCGAPSSCCGKGRLHPARLMLGRPPSLRFPTGRCWPHSAPSSRRCSSCSETTTLSAMTRTASRTPLLPEDRPAARSAWDSCAPSARCYATLGWGCNGVAMPRHRRPAGPAGTHPPARRRCPGRGAWRCCGCCGSSTIGTRGGPSWAETRRGWPSRRGWSPSRPCAHGSSRV
mmetsp:Transcript_25257/g.79754  ORF Transcript_25257/g.79754 Transcript_25257/m.79754 type:complete len:223 (-) Transcript_25257:1380-2048(-)